MSRHRAAGAAAALVLVLAGACGSGGGVDDTDLGLDTTAPAPAGGPATTRAGVLSADDARAQRVNLVLTDFPANQVWSRTPAGPDPAGAEDDRRFMVCLGQDPDPAHRSSELDSDLFSGPGGVRVASSVLVVVEERRAVSDFATLHHAGAEACLKQRLDDQLRRDRGAAAEGTSVERVEFPALGDDRAAFRYRVGGSADLVVDTVFVRVGRVTFNAGFVAQGAPAPAALQRDLVGRMVERARA